MKTLAPLALALVLATPAAAAVVVPDSGTTNYSFRWDDGLGQIDFIDDGFENEWILTLTRDSTVTFTATDGFIPGDVFGLILGGSTPSPWTSTGTSGGYFQGTYSAFLTPGTFAFSLEVTELAPGFTTGRAFASFTVRPSAVPLPAGGLLLIGALGGLALLRRRQTA